ncbi:MAG: ABC transporter ATP-binding protein [Bdellovibrionales bacterium]|nr:ABC transporter ATP-binding protein [Oligoflexia bacterium]
MGIILETKDLVKKYGDLIAVDSLNLKVGEGICFGLLGPNGAGKTTSLEMMESIVKPTSGEIYFRGKPWSRKDQHRIGIQFQSTALPDKLKVREVLNLFQSFYEKTLKLEELIHWCQLEDILHRYSNHLSGGQRQRLLLALGLINDPELLFLDEPTTGLDPQARRQFWDLIRSVKARKKTVVLTTHYMEEAYELCDEIAIMQGGKIIAQGSPDRLLAEHFQGLAIRIPRADWTEGEAIIAGNIFQHSDYVEIQTTEVNSTLKALLERNISLSRVQIRSRNLDDLFLQITGKPPAGTEITE